VNVGAERLQIKSRVALDQHGSLAPLEEMSAFAMSGVVTLRVGALKPLHPADQVWLGRLQQQMIMIAQQCPA
jgi:hypothetical protein